MMTVFALPAFARTIYGNGTGGIYIDIEASPYSDAWDPQWGNPYGTGGCTWFSEARTEQLTGINCAGIIYGVDQWYNTVYSRFGFTRSQSLDRQHKSLICWSSPHIAGVEGFTSSGEIIVSEGGINGWGVNSSHGYCRISTVSSEAELKGRNSGFMGYIILPVPAPGSTVALDVNGLLDDTISGTLGDYGTCDVYIDGSRVADDVVDYYQNWPIGTTYSITDVKAKSGYEYIRVSSGSLSGTLTAAGANVRLEFKSYATLQVNGKLDGSNSSTIGNYGTFDVYINGLSIATGVNYYSAKWPQGTSYELRNIRASSGKYYEGPASGAVKGTLGKGTTSVRLSFLTMLTPTTQWQETTSLPSYLDLSNCEVEYNIHYRKTATSSPGSGWVQVPGSGVTTYVNSGGVQESDFPLETSNTRVLLGTYYYHYCAQGAGEVEHYNDGYHTVYHNVGDINQFYTDWEGADSSDSRYTAYRIKWVSGQWANGYAYCELGSPAVYYRRYQYQNLTAVTNYIWTRDSGWTTNKDSSADSVTYRFRLMSGRTLVLPANLKSIGAQAFAGTDASVITIPNGCTTIGPQAFLNCKNLTRLNIPASVTSIAFDAFDGCDKLVIYAPQGSTAISLASRLGIRYELTN